MTVPEPWKNRKAHKIKHQSFGMISATMTSGTVIVFLIRGEAFMKNKLNHVKLVTIMAFVTTLFTTYYLRSEVLELNRIRYSADNIRAEENIKDLKESYPQRVLEHDIRLKNFELQMEHYEEMLELYRTDYKAYVTRIKDKYHPPQLPLKPQKPKSPELSDQLAQINADFRSQQFHYFDSTSRLNWICCASALILVGGLLVLIMFEKGQQRIFYLVILILSFVFMIGPSFHSLMSAVVGFMRAPMVY